MHTWMQLLLLLVVVFMRFMQYKFTKLIRLILNKLGFQSKQRPILVKSTYFSIDLLYNTWLDYYYFTIWIRCCWTNAIVYEHVCVCNFAFNKFSVSVDNIATAATAAVSFKSTTLKVHFKRREEKKTPTNLKVILVLA